MSVYFTSLCYYFLILRSLLMCFPDKRYFWYPQILPSNSIYIQEKNLSVYFLISYKIIPGISLLTFNTIQNYFKHLQLFKTVVHKYVNFANLRKCREQEAYGNCKQNNFSLNTSSAHVVK